MSESVADWVDKAMRFHMERRYLEALWCLDAARELDPQSIFAWTARGNLLNDVMWFRDAVRAYDAALAIHDAPIAHSNRGIALQNLGRYDEALLSLNQAIELDSAPSWKLNRCDCLLVAGRLDEAQHGYESLLHGAGEPEVVEQSKRMIRECRARQGKGMLGAARKMFGVRPPKNEWKPIMADFFEPGSAFETNVRKEGMYMALMRAIAGLRDGAPDTSQLNAAAKAAVDEKYDNPAGYQRIANAALLPAMQFIRSSENPTERLKDLAEAPDFDSFVRPYLGWIRVAGFMHGFDEGEAAWVREHILYWQLEIRYPGLAEGIWSACGRKPFTGDALTNVLAHEPDRLRQLHDVLQSDRSAFLQSLLDWGIA